MSIPTIVPLREIVAYLDEFLRIREVPDEPNALNGLQVENDGSVSAIVAAVDASQAAIDGAAQVSQAAVVEAARTPVAFSATRPLRVR